MVMLQTIVSEMVDCYSQDKESINIELVINNKSMSSPYMVVHMENYCNNDPIVKRFKIIEYFKKENNHHFFKITGHHQLEYFSIIVIQNNIANHLMRDYHFEPGDDVVISVKNIPESTGYDLNVSIAGSAKYRCLNECEDRLALDSVAKGLLYTTDDYYNIYNRHVKKRKLLLGVIEKFRPELSYDSYFLLQADVIGERGRELVDDFRQRIAFVLENDNKDGYEKMAYDYRKKVNLNLAANIPFHIKYLSKEYAQFLVDKLVCDYLVQYKRINYFGIYNDIQKIKNSDLRDKTTVILFINYKNQMKNIYSSLMDDACSHIQNKECLEKLKYLSARPRN